MEGNRLEGPFTSTLSDNNHDDHHLDRDHHGDESDNVSSVNVNDGVAVGVDEDRQPPQLGEMERKSSPDENNNDNNKEEEEEEEEKKTNYNPVMYENGPTSTPPSTTSVTSSNSNSSVERKCAEWSEWSVELSVVHSVFATLDIEDQLNSLQTLELKELQTSPAAVFFSKAPPEVMELIGSFLDVKSSCQLSQCSHSLRRAAMSKRTWQYWVRRDLCGDFPEIPPGSNFHPKDEYGDRKRVLVQREIDDLKRQDERLKARLRIDWQWRNSNRFHKFQEVFLTGFFFPMIILALALICRGVDYEDFTLVQYGILVFMILTIVLLLSIMCMCHLRHGYVPPFLLPDTFYRDLGAIQVFMDRGLRDRKNLHLFFGNIIGIMGFFILMLGWAFAFPNPDRPWEFLFLPGYIAVGIMAYVKRAFAVARWNDVDVNWVAFCFWVLIFGPVGAMIVVLHLHIRGSIPLGYLVLPPSWPFFFMVCLFIRGAYRARSIKRFIFPIFVFFIPLPSSILLFCLAEGSVSMSLGEAMASVFVCLGTLASVMLGVAVVLGRRQYDPPPQVDI